jgi:hypothetical protein
MNWKARIAPAMATSCWRTIQALREQSVSNTDAASFMAIWPYRAYL